MKVNTQSTTFLPEIRKKSPYRGKPLVELDDAEIINQVDSIEPSECVNQLELMEQEPSIENQNNSVKDSVKEEGPVRAKQITEFDIREMESFNTLPREKLGGMSLSMIYNNKLESKVVQEMMANSKTIDLLNKYNQGEIIE